MSVRGGRGPREDMAVPVSDGSGKRPNGYQRTGRYGRGPGDQRRYERYGDRRGGGCAASSASSSSSRCSRRSSWSRCSPSRGRSPGWPSSPWSRATPGALRIGFIADLVREDLGAVADGACRRQCRARSCSPSRRATRPPRSRPALPRPGSSTSERAFLFQARARTTSPRSSRPAASGWPANLTPEQVVDGLVENRIVIRSENITFREGLRIEQMAAKLQNTPGSARRRQGVLRPRDEAHGRAAGGLPVAARRDHPHEGQLARGLPVPGDLLRSAPTATRRRRPRTWSA